MKFCGKECPWFKEWGEAVKMVSNSRLVVGQVKGELEVKDKRMQGY